MPRRPDFTVEQLIALDDEQFTAAITQDLKYTAGHQSPFQDPRVHQRTLTALITRLWDVNATMDRQAEDPNVSAERYAGSGRFREHIISVIDVTERRVEWAQGRGQVEASAWRALLHEVLDEIEGTDLDDVLDEYVIPHQADMTLRLWIERRRVKDPSRVKAKEVAA